MVHYQAATNQTYCHMDEINTKKYFDRTTMTTQITDEKERGRGNPSLDKWAGNSVSNNSKKVSYVRMVSHVVQHDAEVHIKWFKEVLFGSKISHAFLNLSDNSKRVLLLHRHIDCCGTSKPDEREKHTHKNNQRTEISSYRGKRERKGSSERTYKPTIQSAKKIRRKSIKQWVNCF